MRPRYYRALLSLPNGRLAVFHFTAAGDSLAHASYMLTMADDWPAGMVLRDVSFIGFNAPSAELGSLIVAERAARSAVKVVRNDELLI